MFEIVMGIDDFLIQLVKYYSFRLNRGYFEYTCRECQNIRDRLRKREIVKNNADENINICPEKHKNGNPSHVSVNDQKRRITPHHFRAYTFFSSCVNC